MVDVAAPIRTALIGASTVTAELTVYHSSYPVFTRRPVPDDAPYPLIIVSPDVSVGEEDGLNDLRPVITRDISIYGTNGVDSTNNQYRAVERAAYAVRNLFHRRRNSISVPDWSVTSVVASGPIAAPVDDAQTVGRVVTLIMRLYQDMPLLPPELDFSGTRNSQYLPAL